MNARGPSIALAVLMLAATLLVSVLNAGAVSGSTTASISISGDDDLAAQAASNGWPGDGSSSSPYVISGVVVDAPARGLGIFVSGTTRYLVIEDCTIANTTSYAIDLTGASHVTVRDTVLTDCFCGILVYSSGNCTVTNNTLTGCQTGIQVMSSSDILVSGNSIADSVHNGIELLSATGNVIASNMVMRSGGYGIALISSDGNTIYGNVLTDNNGAGSEYSTDHAQAYDLGTNTWSSGGTGNTWSDWSSSEPYPYEGSAAADEMLNSAGLVDVLPLIAVIAVVVVGVVAVVLVMRKKGQARQAPGQQPPAQHLPNNSGPVQAPSPSSVAVHKPRPWVPAVAAAAVIIVVVVVLASTMGWLPVGSSKLSGARDISGEWEGTGSIWNYNIFGEKAVLINATFEMKLTLDGNHATGVLTITPVTQTPLTDLYVREPVNHLSIDGTYESTKLTFEDYNTVFEFQFLTDMATGKVTNTDDNTYLGLGSDSGAIHLQRV